MNVLKTYLQNVQARLENATPGPWKVSIENSGSIFGDLDTDHNGDNPYVGTVHGVNSRKGLNGDAYLIANCPTDLSTLLQIVRIQSEVIEKIADNTDYFGASDIANEAIEQVNKLVSGGE